MYQPKGCLIPYVKPKTELSKSYYANGISKVFSNVCFGIQSLDMRTKSSILYQKQRLLDDSVVMQNIPSLIKRSPTISNQGNRNFKYYILKIHTLSNKLSLIYNLKNMFIHIYFVYTL